MSKIKTCKKLRAINSYNTWMAIKQRCYNPKNKRYNHYGAKGIILCDRWMVFSAFYSDMGERPKGLTIDRIDNNGNYEPNNCKWSTYKEQMRNTSKNIYLTHEGETMTVTDWATKKGIKANVLRNRIKRGWSPSRLFLIK